MADDTKQAIESYVLSALRKRLDEAAGAVGGAREEILSALSRIESALRSVAGEGFDLPVELLPAPAALPPAAEIGLVPHVLTAQREMLAASDQIGLLTQLLLSCSVSCPRVAFFILKKDSLAGWAARGFERAQDADVRGLQIPLSDDTILGAACRAGTIVRERRGRFSKDAEFLSRLGEGHPAESLAVPIWIRDKIAAVLYGDSGRDEQILDPEIPEVLALHAGLCLETLATRQKYPRPQPADPGPRSAAAPTPAPPQERAAAGPQAGAISSSGPVSVVSAPGGAAPPSPGASAASPAPVSASGVRPMPVAAPPPAPPPAPAAAQAVPAAAPSLESVPEEERKFHEEARRFARLLVSEIVLYNERQVEEGRRQKDLYERLKEDIDRSKGMYDQRVNPKVRTSTRYFYEELVRTLANGDGSAIKVPWA